MLCASVLGGSRKRIAAKQRKENAVFLGMESGWRTNASFDFIEPISAYIGYVLILHVVFILSAFSHIV